jgi:RNA polymerase sigma-70 factor (ECF subfamily)
LKKHPADDPIRAALARDDPAAVELLWDRYAEELLAFLQARLCSRHDAEDVLQAVFVRIVRKRRQLAAARQLNAYVYQIARNEAAQHQRSRQRRGTVGAEDEPWLVAVQSDDAGKELAEQLQTALARLPQGQREVIVLKVYREKTFREIARLLHVSLNTAASRYRYGMEKLRTLLKDSIS